MNILLVSAWLPEQLWLKNLIEGCKSLSPFAQLRIRFMLCGIGPVRAAASISAEIQRAGAAKDPYQFVCFVGTCGSFDLQKFPIQSVVTCSKVLFTDGAAALGKSYFPAENQGKFQTFESICNEHRDIFVRYFSSATCKKVTTIAPPSITTDLELSSHYAKIGEVENLELAGLAAACELAQLPWMGVLGISNQVGPMGHEQWKSYHQSASLVAQELLAKALQVVT